MNSDGFRSDGDESPMPLGEKEADVSVADGHRLVVAFTQLRHQADRRTIIDLAERLGH